MERSLFIFDLDGTLLDTIEDLGGACNHALCVHGFPAHTMEQYRTMVGGGIRLLVERALPCDSRSGLNIDAVLSTFVGFYSENCCVSTHPYPGIREMLGKLSGTGTLAVASNKFDSATQRIIGNFFPETFATVYGHRDGHALKPSPEIVEEIMLENGFSRERTFMIGDSGTDIQTALGAGVHAVAVDWGFRSHDELAGLGAEFIASSSESLCRYLLAK